MKTFGTLRRLMATLELLSQRPVSASELATLLGVDVRTARKMLRELAALGYAQQGGGRYRRYRVTGAARALGARLADVADVDP